MQLVREHSATVVPAHWATVDWSWYEEWNYCAWAGLTFSQHPRKWGKSHHQSHHECMCDTYLNFNVKWYAVDNVIQFSWHWLLSCLIHQMGTLPSPTSTPWSANKKQNLCGKCFRRQQYFFSSSAIAQWIDMDCWRTPKDMVCTMDRYGLLKYSSRHGQHDGLIWTVEVLLETWLAQWIDMDCWSTPKDMVSTMDRYGLLKYSFRHG